MLRESHLSSNMGQGASKEQLVKMAQEKVAFTPPLGPPNPVSNWWSCCSAHRPPAPAPRRCPLGALPPLPTLLWAIVRSLLTPPAGAPVPPGSSSPVPHPPLTALQANPLVYFDIQLGLYGDAVKLGRIVMEVCALSRPAPQDWACWLPRELQLPPSAQRRRCCRAQPTTWRSAPAEQWLRAASSHYMYAKCPPSCWHRSRRMWSPGLPRTLWSWPRWSRLAAATSAAPSTASSRASCAREVRALGAAPGPGAPVRGHRRRRAHRQKSRASRHSQQIPLMAAVAG